MTTTTIVSGQSIGTSTNVGNSKFPTKQTLSPTSAAIVLTLRVTNGAGKGVDDERSVITMWYALSPVSVTAAEGTELLKQNARFVDLRLEPLAEKDRARDSELIVVSGQYLYVWFDVPPFNTAATLNAYLTEL